MIINVDLSTWAMHRKEATSSQSDVYENMQSP